MDLESQFTRTSTTEQMAGQIIMAKAMTADPSLYDREYGYQVAEVQKDADDDLSLEQLVEIRKDAAIWELDADDVAALDAEIAERMYYELRDVLMTLPGKDLQELFEEHPEVYADFFS